MELLAKAENLKKIFGVNNLKWYRDIDLLVNIQGQKNSGYTWEQVFKHLISHEPYPEITNYDIVRKRFNENKYLISKEDIDNNFSYYTYEEAYKALCQYIGKKREIKTPNKKKTKRSKILVLSDPHIPFHNIALIKKVVNEHKDADTLIIPGDFLDCYSVSRFSKKFDIPLKEELTQATSVLDWLAEKFPQIIILEGNHTDRVRKHFDSRISHDLMFLVQYDVLDLISRKYKNVEVVKDKYTFPNDNGEVEIGHFKVIGKDCLIGHFERSSIIPIRAAQYSYQWIANWGEHFGIKNIRLFLTGHTHRLSKYPLNNGIPVIGETGTVCKIQDYAIDGGAKYSAHLNGYWIIYQDDGVTDLNASNFYIL